MASRSAISPDAAWLCDRRQSEPDHVKLGTALSPGCPTIIGAHTEPNQAIEYDIDVGLDQIEMDPVLHHFRR